MDKSDTTAIVLDSLMIVLQIFYILTFGFNTFFIITMIISWLIIAYTFITIFQRNRC